MNSRTDLQQQPGRAADMIRAAFDRYEAQQPRPDARPQDRAFLAWYRGGLLDISQQVQTIRLDRPADLDALFRRVYIPLSVRMGVTPTIADFALLLGVDPDQLARLKDNPSTINIYNGWLNILKQWVISTLSTEVGSNVNLIFIAKSTFGMSDAPGVVADHRRTITKADRETIIAELNGGNVENSANVENFNEQDR